MFFYSVTVAYSFDVKVVLDFMKVVICVEFLGVWDFGLEKS